MSKILFLADLHGNMPATLALEKEIRKIAPDDVYFVGDCVGKGPENDKTLDWVRANCNHFVAGNWDDGIVKGSKNCLPGYESSAFFWNQLSKDQLDWLESLPFEDEVLISGLNSRDRKWICNKYRKCRKCTWCSTMSCTLFKYRTY